MAWFLVAAAGVLEIGWVLGLKFSAGFTRFWPSAATVASMLASMGLLGLAVRTLPMGTAYAVWTGIGAAGTAILGMVLLGEPRTAWRLTSLSLILLGVAGLKLAR